jgi:hypothetical protein
MIIASSCGNNFGPKDRCPIRHPRVRNDLVRHRNRRTSSRDRPAPRIGALDAALKYICSLSGVWRATGWEIVQHFLARLSKRAAAATL